MFSYLPQRNIALFLVMIMVSGPISGCIGAENKNLDINDLIVDVDIMQGGFFQEVEFKATTKMSVFIPYLLIDPETGFVQNSTVIDLNIGEIVDI